MIIDASVAFKWFADEDGSEQALALLSHEQLFAPTLLLSEVGNALWKQARRGQIDPAISFESDLVSLATIVSLLDEAPAVPRALTMARALDHAIYDCVYLAVAELNQQPLVTADRRFFAKTQNSVWSYLIGELA